MKKVLSVLMATLMFLTLLMPLSVFAENGPYPTDLNKITEEELANLDNISVISVLSPYDSTDAVFFYPYEFSYIGENGNDVVSYNEKTNTLNLTNYISNCALVLVAMGDDFKINLKGYNELGAIIVMTKEWGSSVTITGTGTLVINKDSEWPASVEIDATGYGKALFKTEKSVAVKFVGSTDPDTNEAYPTISVYGTKESDSSKVISLSGNVQAESTISEKYPVNIYEQKKVKFVDDITDDAVVFENYYTKDRNYIGFETGIGEDQVMHYDIYTLEYDETLEKNVLKAYAKNEDPVWYDLGISSDQTLPENTVGISGTPFLMDVCIDEDGNECVFLDYSDSDEPGTKVEVYEIINHPIYGEIAIGYNPKYVYKELKLKESYIAYNHLNYSSVITTNTIVTKAPGKVTLKKATNAYGGVKVTWNAVDGASKYKVYRSQYDTKTKKWSKWSALGYSAETSYLDKTAKNGAKYKYTVRAENVLGLGGYDKTGVSTTYIAAPTVKIANASNGIKVSWSKVSGATGYTVYRSQYQSGKWSSWKNMGTLKADKSSWTDKNVTSGVQYKYTVRTVKNKLTSGYKGTSGLVFLSQPTVKIANASTGVKVSWSKVSGATGYTVYRSELSNGKWSSWKNMGTEKSDKTSWTDKNVTSGVQYKYTVRAVTGKSLSSYKASSGLLYLAQPTVKIANASNGIKVSWNKVSGATGYTVYRSQYSNGKWSSWKNMGTAKSDKSSWTDKSVTNGVQYKYTVRAVNGKVKSTYKATSGLVFVSAPTLKATNASYSVKVSWSKVAGATQYKLYRSELKDGKWSSWSTLTTLEADTTSFVDKTVVVDSVYKYTIKAINGSSLSAAASADEIWYSYVPRISVINGETGIVVNWEHINGAEKYIFYRSEFKNGKWTEWKTIKTVNSATEYWVDETVVSDVKYKYAIKAQKGDDKTVSEVSKELVYIKTSYRF